MLGFSFFSYVLLRFYSFPSIFLCFPVVFIHLYRFWVCPFWLFLPGFCPFWPIFEASVTQNNLNIQSTEVFFVFPCGFYLVFISFCIFSSPQLLLKITKVFFFFSLGLVRLDLVSLGHLLEPLDTLGLVRLGLLRLALVRSFGRGCYILPLRFFYSH